MAKNKPYPHAPMRPPTPGSASKKRRIVYMDGSDDENTVLTGSPAVRAKQAKVIDGHKSPRPGKRARLSGPMSGATTSKAGGIQEQRRALPIFKGKDAIVQKIKENDVTVLIGETGSGKTTQIPQYLHEAGLCNRGMIAITQPRRVAAISLAARVAQEQDTTVGALVGYAVRFDEASSADTKIKFMTDGMLVRELLGDEWLERYSVVVVDEAHERTIRTDVLLARLKEILAKRNAPGIGKGKGKDAKSRGKGKGKEKEWAPENPLKVVVMSATLDAEKFSTFFGGAPILYVQGRQHPVTIYHTSTPQPDYVDAALRTFYQIHTDQPTGDVLIFLPGQEDIESLDKSIKLYANRLPQNVPAVLTLPLYAAMPPSAQGKIFQPTPKNTRKVILATNIAETSITIPGVRYVIDTGKCKERRWLTGAGGKGVGFDTLLTRDITKSSALQRTGRAGRESAGTCFRLYTESAFSALPLSAEPDIMRCSLTSSVLQLKCLGQDLEEMDFLEKPDGDSIGSALITLYLLGALSDKKTLTSQGRKMALFPLEPALARAVLASCEFGCTAEVLRIVSVLSSSAKLFLDDAENRDAARTAHARFRHAAGDHLGVLSVVRAYEEVCAGDEGRTKAGRRAWCARHHLNYRCLAEATDVLKQLQEVCARAGIDATVSVAKKAGGEEEEAAVLRSLVRGLVQNTAFLQPDGKYKQVMGASIVRVHPGSALMDKKVPAILYDELVYTTNIYARGVSAIPRSYIAEVPVLNHRGS